jgi:hypothetical protein
MGGVGRDGGAKASTSPAVQAKAASRRTRRGRIVTHGDEAIHDPMRIE